MAKEMLPLFNAEDIARPSPLRRECKALRTSVLGGIQNLLVCWLDRVLSFCGLGVCRHLADLFLRLAKNSTLA